MDTHASAIFASKRALLLRDGVTFLILSAVTVALFGVTLFLFRSFEEHRADLAQRWSARGRVALQQQRPAEAVGALRNALSYAPDDLPDQMLLAQALADAGHTEEATNYFLTLRESRPGDGLINLQLARLARRRGDAQEATNYYRAAIFGDWSGDGAERRREVRLELADFLAGRGDLTAAKAEILVAAGNAPPTPTLDLTFADRLAAIGDLPDALTLYRQALTRAPHDAVALARAGRAAYGLGDYPEANRLLTAAVTELHHAGQQASAPPTPGMNSTELEALAADARRLPELSLARTLPAQERAAHLVLAAGIARKRLDGCNVPVKAPTGKPAVVAVPPAAPPDPALVALAGRWTAARTSLGLRALERDAALDDTVTQLITDTEVATAQHCSPPTGDDALLLQELVPHNAPPAAAEAAPAGTPSTASFAPSGSSALVRRATGVLKAITPGSLSAANVGLPRGLTR